MNHGIGLSQPSPIARLRLSNNLQPASISPPLNEPHAITLDWQPFAASIVPHDPHFNILLDLILNEIKNAPQFLTDRQFPIVQVDLQTGGAGMSIDLTPDTGMAEIELRYGNARLSLSHGGEQKKNLLPSCPRLRQDMEMFTPVADAVQEYQAGKADRRLDKCIVNTDGAGIAGGAGLHRQMPSNPVRGGRGR